MCGGWSETKAVTSDTPKIQKICNDVQSQVETITKETYRKAYEAVEYKDCRVENGTNFLIKVRVGEPKYIHLYVYESSTGGLELHCVQENKTKDDLLSCC